MVAINKTFITLICFSGLLFYGCGGTDEPDTTGQETTAPASTPEIVVTVSPGPDVQMELQEALIEVEPGTVIQLEEGVYDFQLGLSLDVDGVTLRGRGHDKTILDFTNQDAGAEGIYVSSDDVVLEDFAIINTKSNGIKSHSANNIVYRRIRAEWTDGPKESNGAYGLYPVSSENVLVEECIAIGASDAGIYVGQSNNVIVRDCRVEYNVAGIEIENCHNADVIRCTATNNTGGLLVFDLPDLPVQHGHNIRFINNKSFDNNTRNFAPAGNIVGTVPSGTGIMIMTNENVEILENEVYGNNTTNVLIVSYLTNGKKLNDPNYYPYPEKIHVHNNVFGPGGTKPGGAGGMLMSQLLGTPLPDIVWDGVINPKHVVDGKVNPDVIPHIHDNTKSTGEVTFASLGGLESLSNPANAKINRNIDEFGGTLPSLPAIKMP
jgi:parallel beta-helix repeat protein